MGAATSSRRQRAWQHGRVRPWRHDSVVTVRGVATDTEDGQSSTGAGQLVLFLTASLFVASEPPREARRGTIVRQDYDGYCCVTSYSYPNCDETWRYGPRSRILFFWAGSLCGAPYDRIYCWKLKNLTARVAAVKLFRMNLVASFFVVKLGNARRRLSKKHVRALPKIITKGVYNIDVTWQAVAFWFPSLRGLTSFWGRSGDGCHDMVAMPGGVATCLLWCQADPSRLEAHRFKIKASTPFPPLSLSFFFFFLLPLPSSLAFSNAFVVLMARRDPRLPLILACSLPLEMVVSPWFGVVGCVRIMLVVTFLVYPMLPSPYRDGLYQFWGGPWDDCTGKPLGCDRDQYIGRDDVRTGSAAATSSRRSKAPRHGRDGLRCGDSLWHHDKVVTACGIVTAPETGRVHSACVAIRMVVTSCRFYGVSDCVQDMAPHRCRQARELMEQQEHGSLGRQQQKVSLQYLPQQYQSSRRRTAVTMVRAVLLERFLRLRPSVFYHDYDLDRAESWMHELERTFETMKCTEEDQKFLEVFHGEYFLDYARRERPDQFHELVQGDLNVAQYHQRTHVLVRLRGSVRGNERTRVMDSRVEGKIVCKKQGQMRGECPELKKKLKKDKFTFKKAKAMLATWSDEDEDDNSQATSGDDEVHCLMARSEDSNEVDTGPRSQNSLFSELEQQVDTTTRAGRHWINSQNSLFAEWDSRSTQDESRSTLDLVPRIACFQKHLERLKEADQVKAFVGEDFKEDPQVQK
ncbi:hypothetical protein Taro_000956 [Colocasia esculenta]|uniref:Retrotransposon gag domain-containing protein n=1 Tax=Colocasia esculenta TaxID=4460 RepID=A0A843TJ99_COLES|nr:hypothetical protein [Colocasia esculenta]